MIFIESKGRFGNFLFQFFFAKLIQKKIKKKIIVFSEIKNKNFFKKEPNIYNLINDCSFFPKYSLPLKFLKNKILNFNDKNFKKFFYEYRYINKKTVYLDGFFQDIDIVNDNIDILNNFLDIKSEFETIKINQPDLTIHIRDINTSKNSIDDHPLYKIQPNIDFYINIIDYSKPKKIKVISSNKNNNIINQLKKIYKDKLIICSNNELQDFLDLMNSRNLILSNSTFSLWAGLLSKSRSIYIPHIGILKKILNKKKLNIRSKQIFID